MLPVMVTNHSTRLCLLEEPAMSVIISPVSFILFSRRREKAVASMYLNDVNFEIAPLLRKLLKFKICKLTLAT